MKTLHLFLAVLIGGAPFATAAPRIAFEQTRHDFGEVEPGTLRCEFKFKNTGDQVLEIRGVHAGCGCTVVQDYPRRLEPGQEGALRAELNVTHFKGRIEKGIHVTSNDPANPNAHLVLAATVIQNLMVEPPNTVWNNLTPDSVTNAEVVIRSRLPLPLEIEKVTSSVPWLGAEIVASSPQTATLRLQTKPPLPSGLHHALITVETRYEKDRVLHYHANINVPTLFTAIPSRVTFLKSRPMTISVLLTRNDGRNFAVTEVRSESSQITGLLTTNEPGRSYSLRVSYQPPAGQAPEASKVVILTDEPTWPRVELPVVFR